jgi:hypothetical protein
VLLYGLRLLEKIIVASVDSPLKFLETIRNITRINTHCLDGRGRHTVDNGMNVILFEKKPDGELVQIEERSWTMNMIAALEHVNYIVVGGREYETIEGRLNVDTGTLELLLVPMRND